VIDTELNKELNKENMNHADLLREDGDAENLKRKRRRIKDSINKTNKIKKVQEQKKSGLSGQDMHDLNRISKNPKMSGEEKGSKKFFDKISSLKDKNKMVKIFNKKE